MHSKVSSVGARGAKTSGKSSQPIKPPLWEFQILDFKQACVHSLCPTLFQWVGGRGAALQYEYQKYMQLSESNIKNNDAF